MLASKVAMTLASHHVVGVLQETLTCHGRPKIVNVDHGVQFRADEFAWALKVTCNVWLGKVSRQRRIV